MEHKHFSRAKSKKRHRGLKIILFLFVMTAGIIGVYMVSVYSHVSNATNKMYTSLENVDNLRDGMVSLGNKEAISILLLGVDSGDLGRTEQGRSDTMILATINPNTKKTVLMSIPRDTYAEIIGNGSWDKLNHAYAYGGTSMSVNSVQNLFDVPIDYYVTVNMAGIQEIVDAVGGIDIISPLTFEYEGYQFYEGESVHLDGKTALAFARMRYDDPDGDFGRQLRQRLVIEGIISKAVDPANLLNYREILNSLSSNIQTNFQMDDFFELQGNSYSDALRNIQAESFEGEGNIADDGVWYYYIYEEELNRIQTMLHEELEIN
jgi:LCP family protein required for cell wall assembly